MKNINKIMLIILGVCFVMLMLPETASAQAQTIVLEANPPYGFSKKYYPATLNGASLAVGDKYVLNYSFTANVAIDSLSVAFVDTTERANWWMELSEYFTIMEDIQPNTVVSGTITLEIKSAPTSATRDANVLYFSVNNGTRRAPTLSFTTFELKKQ